MHSQMQAKSKLWWHANDACWHHSSRCIKRPMKWLLV